MTVEGLSQIIDFKLNRNDDKQIVCGSKVRFREVSLETYLPAVKCNFDLLTHCNFGIGFGRCELCHEIHINCEQSVMDEGIKSYMRANHFVVRFVTATCCVIGQENNSLDKAIHVCKCALEF